MKNLKNLGQALSKAEQQTINGGRMINCYSNPICPPYNEISCIVIAGTCHYYPGEGG